MECNHCTKRMLVLRKSILSPSLASGSRLGMFFKWKSTGDSHILKHSHIQDRGRIQEHGCLGSGHHSVAYISTNEQDLMVPCLVTSAYAPSLHAGEPGMGSPGNFGDIL